MIHNVDTVYTSLDRSFLAGHQEMLVLFLHTATDYHMHRMLIVLSSDYSTCKKNRPRLGCSPAGLNMLVRYKVKDRKYQYPRPYLYLHSLCSQFSTTAMITCYLVYCK